ncbi:MAG: hypothetical protein RIR18_1308 [Pseudomonadota bacterium]|jgi:hypothetical protein
MNTAQNQIPELNPLPDGWFLNGSGIAAETLAIWANERPCLFSNTRVWVNQNDLQVMADGIAAIEQVLHDPRYQAVSDGSPGVLFGYDFHLGKNGPQLIEINTNAGGAFLTASLGEAWADREGQSLAPRKQVLQSMFEQEWLAVSGYAPTCLLPPGLLVIVDESPAAQYLYPEFELCRRWLSELGWSVVIASPDQLVWDGETLMLNGQAVSMVYNRLTDFSLEAPAVLALKLAYEASAIVLTPHPQLHATMADKSHLVTLADDAYLASIGIGVIERQRIAKVLLPCAKVSPANAETLWQHRKTGFFKPVAGYGSKAAYRGDKLTKRVFEEILAGDYIVQQIVPPSERVIQLGDETHTLKLDIRNYTYQGQVLGVVARLYQGQTTNFRTPGGGFAPVYSAPV